jgi:general secretion pathway protein G
MMELAAKRSHEQELREALRQIRTALDGYKQAVDEGRVVEETKGSGYPPSLEVLVSGVVDAKSPNNLR